MTPYNSLDEIKRDFHLDVSSPDDLRKELRQLQKTLHPDLQLPPGQFASEGDRQKFERIEEAINFIDMQLDQRRRDTALVPVRTITDVVQIVRDLTASRATADSEQRIATQTSRAVANFRYQHRLPKITASAIAALATALWLFPSTIKDHPILSRFLDPTNPMLLAVWFYSVVGAAALWLWLTIRENRLDRFVSTLKVEAVQNQLFKDFLRERRDSSLPGPQNDSERRRFTKDDFVRHLVERRRRRIPLGPPLFPVILTGGDHIDLELGQAIADAVLIRAEAKGVVAKDPKGGLADVYNLLVDVE